MTSIRCIAAALAFAGTLLSSVPAMAVEWSARVHDAQGRPLKDAVVSLSGGALARPTEPAVMDQVHMQFAPRVLAVRTGTQVVFPNRDDIRHQVYSFSPAKRFELRLYHGTPSEPVTFDKPGLVVLGCNIHDQMVGYIYVTDDARVAVTDNEGRVRFDMPAGRYGVTLWHPELAEPAAINAGDVQVDGSHAVARYDLSVTPAPPEAAPANGFEALFRNTVRDAKP